MSFQLAMTVADEPERSNSATVQALSGFSTPRPVASIAYKGI